MTNEEVKEEGAYAGFTESEWRRYADNHYSFSPPPVATVLWTDESWMIYIFGPRKPIVGPVTTVGETYNERS